KNCSASPETEADMLDSLTIRNTAIIDFLTIGFGPGMNCLTGETGAGKSIIIDSICFLLGERMSRESIRQGAEEAQITGVFTLSEEESERIDPTLVEIGIEPEPDGTVILFRSCNLSGRGTCRINDRIVTLSTLRRLGELLVDVHGQHDNHSLLSPSTHIGLLDAFAGPELAEASDVYSALLSEYRRNESELEEISGDPQKRAQLIDLLTFQTDEIFTASLKDGEDTQLEERQKLIDNAENISKGLASAVEAIAGGGDSYGDAGGARGMLDNAITDITRLGKYSDSFGECLEKLRECSYILDDALDMIRNAFDSVNVDEKEAGYVAERLDLIYALKRKYGDSIDEIKRFAEDAEERLEKLKGSEETAARLNARQGELRKLMKKAALRMHALREKAAEKLKTGIMNALADMEMGKVVFETRLDFDDRELPQFGKNGLDTAEFMISTNPGELPRPLARIASGGELSRIMLAMKSCLAEADRIPVLIFDEIDTGISGAAAAAVAGKFMRVSRSHQVICVSHLAQIAAISDNNIFISKTFGDNFVRTDAETLDEEGKIREVGRLLDGDGDATGVTRAHSIELIARMRERAAREG
ncbi:MAG: DNA repair protein RecN, partial [Clostridia bacterium]|nr:DNA repair protein RecN [Clostridia bacterium]